MRLFQIALAVTAVTAAACGGGTTSDTRLIAIDGSSTVFPISEAVAEEFFNATGTRVTVGISGTGGGFQRFCRGETDISNASRPIRTSEIQACRQSGVEYIELPIAYDGIAIVVHPANTWADTITIAELKTLWEPDAQGRVTRWNQIRPSWPDREIHLFGAGVDSGTYDYFTEAVVGAASTSRGDFTSSEDDNVLVQGVVRDELALAFLPLAYVEANRAQLRVVPVDQSAGRGPIEPSIEAVRDGTYQPLSRPLFLYVSRDAAERPEVQQLVRSFFTSRDLIRDVGYIELPPELYDLAERHFSERRLGTAFEHDGSQVGMTIEELLARER